jgi:hypothetical protein
MRRAALAALGALLLAACAAPAGAPVAVECDATWRFVESHIRVELDAESQTVGIECFRQAGRRRLRLGFMMPPGPGCYGLTGIEVVESGEAVSVTLSVAPNDDPLAGACPEEPMRAATEIELQAPVANRELLDASR